MEEDEGFARGQVVWALEISAVAHLVEMRVAGKVDREYVLRVGQGRGFLLVCVFPLLPVLALLMVLDRCF